MTVAARSLRGRAEALGQAFPPLLAAAEHLAATVILGQHGRRRSGMGDEFWQYRPAHPGDSARMIDWRRSAQGDAHFVREHEWQAAQSVVLWVDGARSMAFTGDPRHRETKAERARLLALAVAVLLLRGGERVGLAGADVPPRAGRGQVLRIAAALGDRPEDYGAPDTGGMAPRGRAVFLSDFLGDPAGVEAALSRAAGRGVRGALMQILDPVEEDFPFDGRTVFESMAGSLRHETRRAGDLRERYLTRLAERRDRIAAAARAAGWQFTTHHTGQPAQSALMWLYRALERDG